MRKGAGSTGLRLRCVRAAGLILLAVAGVRGLAWGGQGQTLPAVPLNQEGELAPARAAYDRQQWAEAEALARQYLGKHEHSATGLYLLASTLFHEDRARESLTVFTQAAQTRPPSATDLRLVALDYVLLDDYADADRWITRSAQENPTDGETWYAMGRIKYTENRFGEAVDSFSKCLQLEPRLAKAENNLGLAYEALNRPDEAIAAYRMAIAWERDERHPSEQPMLNLGILLTDRNALDEALVLLKQAETLAPADGRVHGALGRLYARRGELPQAQAELLQAVTAQPSDAGLHFQLGQVYRKQGEKERAAAELARAAELERAQRTGSK
ncbi:MAG TPA: tetratricopeptide repeat protein [Acidobacteriaceae bacterium]|nr:tetratricopeptide repeat protein [Acidobacteriaceae bacterium]